MRPNVVAVVVTHNSAHVVCELLDSLAATSDGLVMEVVVVDNASTDGTADLVEARGDCVVLRSPNLGYAGGVNRGVRNATTNAPVLVLNPDVRLGRGAVSLLLERLSVPGTGVAVPRVLDERGQLHLSLRREPTLARAAGLARTGRPSLSEYVSDPRAYEHPANVDWALGAVMLVARECYDDLHGWDESFFLYGEETDFCLRAKDRGWITRYEPLAVAVHIGAQSGQSSRTHTMQILNRVRLYRRRNGAVRAWAYFALTVASEASWWARRAERSRFAIEALLQPSRRPSELGCSTHLMPS